MTAWMGWSLWLWERTKLSAEGSRPAASGTALASLPKACRTCLRLGTEHSQADADLPPRFTTEEPPSQPVNRRPPVVPGAANAELGPSGKEGRRLISRGVRTTRTPRQTPE